MAWAGEGSGLAVAALPFHPGLAHPLIARIEDQIGKRLGQGTPGKLRQASSSR
jgi:hypothetical protein